MSLSSIITVIMTVHYLWYVAGCRSVSWYIRAKAGGKAVTQLYGYFFIEKETVAVDVPHQTSVLALRASEKLAAQGTRDEISHPVYAV
jgi:hypothetical protein